MLVIKNIWERKFGYNKCGKLHLRAGVDTFRTGAKSDTFQQVIPGIHIQKLLAYFSFSVLVRKKNTLFNLSKTNSALIL